MRNYPIIQSPPAEPKIVRETLRRLLSGPAKRSELPRTQNLWSVIRVLNEEMEPAGRRIVTRQVETTSRLGLAVKEIVYELVTVR